MSQHFCAAAIVGIEWEILNDVSQKNQQSCTLGTEVA